MSVGEKILFIVEGERLERELIERLSEEYCLHCEITSVCTNIYCLYQKLKNDDGFSDVIPVLCEYLQEQISHLQTGEITQNKARQIKQKQDDLGKLKQSFSSVYLVFDSDLHHHSQFVPNAQHPSQ